MSSVLPVYELVVQVAASDIDEQGHVNNTVHLRWVQDAATAHWRAIASEEAQAAIGWVVLRHEIDYKAPALPGDEVLLRTREIISALASSRPSFQGTCVLPKHRALASRSSYTTSHLLGHKPMSKWRRNLWIARSGRLGRATCPRQWASAEHGKATPIGTWARGIDPGRGAHARRCGTVCSDKRFPSPAPWSDPAESLSAAARV